MFAEALKVFVDFLKTDEVGNLIANLLETFKTDPTGGVIETVVTAVLSFPTTIFPMFVALLMDLGLVK